uniref:ACT domain-containing protein n=1 Tax=Rhizophora mucronata TaxID=61149 RepID=A0A2P2NZH9_RHIMU
MGLLSNMTRVFRENGLSVSRAEIGIHGDKAVGSLYVTDASGYDVSPHAVEQVRAEIGRSILVVNKSPGWTPRTASMSSINSADKDKPKFSLGSLLWSQLERLSSNFGSIRS